jgi:hypothetical protein
MALAKPPYFPTNGDWRRPNQKVIGIGLAIETVSGLPFTLAAGAVGT